MAVTDKLLEVLEEQQGQQGEKSFAHTIDLDGVRHLTRFRKDVTQRAKYLAFGSRMVDRVRWTYLMGATAQ